MAWTLGGVPSTASPVGGRAIARLDAGVRRPLAQRGWDWFDELSNLQTACCLSAMVLGLAIAVVLLFAAGIAPAGRAAPSAVAVAPSVAAVDPARLVISATPTASGWARAHTLPPGVNLRARPTTSAPTLATLPANTPVLLLGETAFGDNATWQHVRTEDGRDGWIIDSALE